MGKETKVSKRRKTFWNGPGMKRKVRILLKYNPPDQLKFKVGDYYGISFILGELVHVCATICDSNQKIRIEISKDTIVGMKYHSCTTRLHPKK